jgi:tRNA pseudouridine32 synthase/23S rRNA pseudouridine746 synthase
MVNKLHKRLHTLEAEGIELPPHFTYPFCYTPHPLAVLAAKEVQKHIATMDVNEGKMFGVLVVTTADNRLGFLAAYSGLLCGRNDWPYFVPPVFDAQQPDGHFKQMEREISIINEELRMKNEEFATAIPSPNGTAIPSSDGTPVENSSLLTLNSSLKERRRQLSEELQMWLFHQYRFLNALGQEKDLLHVWQDYHCSARIRKKYPLPPGGTGDCCAPKLLQYAYQHQLHPVCMAEFWWGESPERERLADDNESGMVRHHGKFYPACRGKCKPVLTWMMQGLDVDINPETFGFPHLSISVVYEDDDMAVVAKPAGLLSVPGRVETYSVATLIHERWPDAVLVHRLDMGTSGLLVVGKTSEAYRNLQSQFYKRTVRKQYVALLEGPLHENTPLRGTIRLPLLCDPLNRPRQVVDYRRGKTAVTDYEVLATNLYPAATDGTSTPPWGQSQGPFTLIALSPHTGRTHQLRMHCAHPDGLNCPIVGDELYGHTSEGARLCLHAQQLWLQHPVTGNEMHFELPHPFDNLTPYNNK